MPGRSRSLKELDAENMRLKKLLAESLLENEVTREALRKKWGLLSRIGAKWSVLAASNTLFVNRLRALLSTLYRTGDSTLKRPGRL